ncbi:MAG: PAS domain S-box protein, partial [Bacteriovorax sp.]
LLLTSLAILLMNSSSARWRTFSESSILISGGVALLSFAGFLTGANSLYSIIFPSRAVGMALQTAISFIFLSVGTLCFIPREGVLYVFFSESLGGVVARKLVLLILFAPIVIDFVVLKLVSTYLLNPTLGPSLIIVANFSVFILLSWITVRKIDLIDTERRKLQSNLEESEEKYRSLIELAPESIFVADITGKYVEVNEAACKLLKLPKEEIIGKTIIDLIPEEEKERLESSKKYLQGSGETETAEWKLKRGDGSFVDVEVSSKILSHDRWIAFVRSLEDRKKAEEQLLRAETRYRGLFESAVESIVVVDLEGTIRLVNPRTKSFFGYDDSELIGRPIEILVPERFRSEHIIERSNYSKNPTSRQMGSGLNIFARRKDGSEFFADISLSLTKSSDDKKMVTAIIRDITEQKKIERGERVLALVGKHLPEILDMREHLKLATKLIVDELGDWSSVILISEDSRSEQLIVYHRDPNKSAIAAELMNQPITDTIHNRVKEVLEKKEGILLTKQDISLFLDEVLQSERHKLYEKLGLYSVCHIPLVARGRAFGLFSLANAERDYSQEEFDRIKLVVAKIALSADNAYLYQEAMKATKVREDLMAVVSHDLRNPLAAIDLGAQSLKRLATDSKSTIDEIRATLLKTSQRLNSSVKRSLALISDLLTFAKIESGGLVLEKSELDIDSLIEEAIEGDLLLAQNRGVQLNSVVEGPHRKINADHSKLLQVLANLIGNALKFTESGGAIQIRASLKSKDEILFQVTDTGSGMKEEELLHIFDRYWQPKRTQGQGTGLGLSIAKGVVEAHGGRIWAESQFGKGSTFFFTIPTR